MWLHDIATVNVKQVHPAGLRQSDSHLSPALPNSHSKPRTWTPDREKEMSKVTLYVVPEIIEVAIAAADG
jgi:hypothetical protein